MLGAAVMLNMKAKQAAVASSSEKNSIDVGASSQGGAAVKPTKTGGGRKKTEVNGEKNKSARKRTPAATIPMRENIRPNLGVTSSAPFSAATYAAAKTTAAPLTIRRKVLGEVPLNPNVSRTQSRTRASTQKQDSMQAMRASGGARKRHALVQGHQSTMRTVSTPSSTAHVTSSTSVPRTKASSSSGAHKASSSSTTTTTTSSERSDTRSRIRRAKPHSTGAVLPLLLRPLVPLSFLDDDDEEINGMKSAALVSFVDSTSSPNSINDRTGGGGDDGGVHESDDDYEDDDDDESGYLSSSSSMSTASLSSIISRDRDHHARRRRRIVVNIHNGDTIINKSRIVCIAPTNAETGVKRTETAVSRDTRTMDTQPRDETSTLIALIQYAIMSIALAVSLASSAASCVICVATDRMLAPVTYHISYIAGASAGVADAALGCRSLVLPRRDDHARTYMRGRRK